MLFNKVYLLLSILHSVLDIALKKGLLYNMNVIVQLVWLIYHCKCINFNLTKFTYTSTTNQTFKPQDLKLKKSLKFLF